MSVVKGAKPLRRVGGGVFNVNRYYCNVSDALYLGDIVSLEGTADSEGVPSVIACTPSLVPVGVIVGFEANKDVIDTQLYKKAGDAMYVLVADDSDLIFDITVDATFAAADLGSNYDLVFAEGSTVTGYSGMKLDVGTAGTSASLHMKALRKSAYPDNDFGTDTIVECKWSQHSLGNVDSVGV